MKPYVIKQGDYLSKVAHRQGFNAKKVWNHAKNAELKALRGDGEILKAGDILFVPDEPRTTNPFKAQTTNQYVASVPKVPVELKLTTDDGPLADERFIVEGIGDDTERITDPAGVARFEVDVHTREVTIALLDRDEKCLMRIGDVDPVDEPSGARMRLTALGFYGPTTTGADGYVPTDDARLSSGLTRFQRASGLEPTGDLDEATQRALRDAYGS